MKNVRYDLKEEGGMQTLMLHKTQLVWSYLFMTQMWGKSATFKRKWFVLLIRLFTYSYSDITFALRTAFSLQYSGFMVC